MRHQMGVVSEGRLRNEALVSCFVAELDNVDPDALKALRADYGDLLDLLDGDAEIDWTIEDWHEVLDALVDALNAAAEPYWYFGTCEGDGACFGWWLDDNAIREAVADGEITPLDETPYLVLVRNDHGNQTLYTCDYKELWAVV